MCYLENLIQPLKMNIFHLQTEKDLNPQKAGVHGGAQGGTASVWVLGGSVNLCFIHIPAAVHCALHSVSEGSAEHNTGGALQGPEAVAT